jgi:hypothetical protein|tara:strand:- start:341 stop:679 length:339 start_codon:yes stop_codon:yes gene_type:complete
MTSRADAELPFYIRREHAMPYLTTPEFPTVDQQAMTHSVQRSHRVARRPASCFTHVLPYPMAGASPIFGRAQPVSIGSSTYRSCPPPAHWAGQSRRAGNVSPRITQAWFIAE